MLRRIKSFVRKLCERCKQAIFEKFMPNYFVEKTVLRRSLSILIREKGNDARSQIEIKLQGGYRWKEKVDFMKFVQFLIKT